MATKSRQFVCGFSRCYDGVGQLLMGQKKKAPSVSVFVQLLMGPKKGTISVWSSGSRCDGLTYGGDSATDGESGFPHQCA